MPQEPFDEEAWRMKTAGDILIVDDESDIRLLIGAILRDEGFTTMEAASAVDLGVSS